MACPRISRPSPHVRSMSHARRRIPLRRPSGIMPTGAGQVKQSSAVAIRCGSGSKGFERKPQRDPDVPAVAQHFSQQTRCLRRRPPIGVIGKRAQLCRDFRRRQLRRAARHLIDGPIRAPATPTEQRDLECPLGQDAHEVGADLFTSQPSHRLGVANCSSSRSSSTSAIPRRSSAVRMRSRSIGRV